MSGETQGEVRIRSDADSYFLSEHVPHEIRDSSLRLVATVDGTGTTPLDPGLYVVDTMSPDGSRQSRPVEVVAGETVDILVSGATSVSAAPDRTIGRESLAYPTMSTMPRSTSPGDDVDAISSVLSASHSRSPDEFELLSLESCVLVAEDADSLTFEPAQVIEATPTATFSVGADVVSISLPIHDRASYPLNSAVVEVDRSRRGRVRLISRFAPERRVANTLDRLLGSGAVIEADRLFSAATDLLFGKYQDPPAAAFGALTMHRLGRLHERPDWIENLARGFTWFPDGKILLAALLRDDPDPAERARGRSLLIEAATMRPMFTDGMSLMMTLLRRSATDDDGDEAQELLRMLAVAAASAHLDAMCLTTTVNQELLS